MITNHQEQSSNPMESTVFQMMCQLSNYLPTELDTLYLSCKEAGQEWNRCKRLYADYVVELFKKWSN